MVKIFVGTFTDGFAGGALAEGIPVFDLDEATGAFTAGDTLRGLNNPSFIAKHPSLPVLYTVERYVPADRRERTAAEKALNALTTLAIAPDGKLSAVAKQPPGGDNPAHVTIHPASRHVIVSNAGSGDVTVFPTGADGWPGAQCSSAHHEGRGPNAVRQKTAYPHAAFIHPSGDFVFECDLGLDRVMIYRFDQRTGALTPGAQPFVQVSSGAGPRHLAFNPNGRFFYVLNELDATTASFSFDPATGAAAIVHTLPIDPPTFRGHKSAAQILVGPSGKFLYSSSRSNSTLATYRLDHATGEMEIVAHQSSEGKTPRNFNFTPSGGMMIAANQLSGSLVSFHVNGDTGALTPTGHSVATRSPVCVVFG